MVAILGGRLPTKKIAKELREKNVDVIIISPSLKNFKFKKVLRDHKIIHFLGSPTVSMIGIISLLRFKMWKKKIVVTWRGTDILMAKENIFFRIASRLFQSLIDVNNSLSQHSIEELQSIGVKTNFQPNPTFKLFKIRDLPKSKKIAVYLPDSSENEWNFYQGNLIKKIVNDFPKNEFIIIRNSGKKFDENNVKCHEWVEDMEELYSQVIGVIRLPIHDAIGNTIVEAISMGRNVIASSVKFPFCKTISNYDELKISVKELVENPKLNENGAKFVHEKYDKEKIIKKMIQIYDKLSKN